MLIELYHRLLALGLELSEDTLTKLTSYDSRNRSFCKNITVIFRTWLLTEYSHYDSSLYDVVSQPLCCCVDLVSMRIYFSSPRPEEEEIQSNNLWLKGHVGSSLLSDLQVNKEWWHIVRLDSNLLSVLWSQPVSGLNIRGHEDGEWRWVKHVDNALVRLFFNCINGFWYIIFGGRVTDH